MTAQQPQNPTLRLLIAENSENEAHAFDSLLRDAGIATRTEVVDLNMALESMTEADMLLANSDLPELQQLMPNLRASATFLSLHKRPPPLHCALCPHSTVSCNGARRSPSRCSSVRW